MTFCTYLTLITQKLQVVCGHCKYGMTALILEMTIFCVIELDERYDWWVTPPNMHHSLFPISHVCVYSELRRITWKLLAIYGRSAYRTNAVLSETFFVWFKVTQGIRLESCGPRHTFVVLWYSIMCVYCKSVYTSLFGTQLRLTTNLIYLMTAYYIPNDSFTANDISFYKNKVGKLHYTLQRLINQSSTLLLKLI